MNVKEQLKEGLVTKNPVLVQLMGMCSVLAITTSLFNGIGMMRAYVYNDSTAEPCDVVDAIVGSMGVNIADETGIVLADGITNGSSFDDVVATYGTNYDERDEDDYKSYTFSMGSSVKTKFNVIDNTVIYIEIQTGI